MKKMKGRPYEPATHLVDATNMANASERYPDVYYQYQAGQLPEPQMPYSSFFRFRCSNAIVLEVHFYTSELVRIRYALRQPDDGFSYAMDPAYQPATPEVHFQSTDTHFSWQTEHLEVILNRETARFQFKDRDTQQLMLAQEESFLVRETVLEGVNHLRVTWQAQPEEAYYGLGDKSANLNLRGGYFQNWNTDSFAYEKDTDPLYRAIPFYYGLAEGGAYGIFFNNSYRTHFDFDSRREGCTRMWTEGGTCDFFYLHGPDINQVCQTYHQLTGRPELPPHWALGFHQCRWSYYPEERVRELAATFRQLQIPCDAIYLDIDYMDGYRCFTWNKEYFPQPTQMIADLKEDGFHTVVMIDPGIRVDPDYRVYVEGKEDQVFCKRSNGDAMLGPVWPPECEWPDYTDPDAREWWGEQYRELYNENGVSGFWNDMNEPAVFKVKRATFPDEVLHHYDHHPTNHAKAHNIYGQQMTRASYEGFKNLQPEKRPFLLTRATFSGGQRYAAVWTGDNIASWEHLRLANIQCQRLSISGFSFCGTDIGGFVGIPDGELMVRWLQLGVFHPIYRVHSMGNNEDGAAEAEAEAIKTAERENRLDQEPWSFGEPHTTRARQAIELRYRLFPYLYTTFQQHVAGSMPVLRSLVFEDQTDAIARERENEFFCGPHLMVSPVLKAGQQTQQVYLPKGQWQEYESGKLHQGPGFIRVSVATDRLPMFVRAGAILPHYPVRQHTGEAAPEIIDLNVYTAGEEESYLYIDEGEGYAYAKGAYRFSTFLTENKDGHLKIRQSVDGSYTAKSRQYRITLRGDAAQHINTLEVDGKTIHQEAESDRNSYLVPLNFEHIQTR